ncbi:Growth_factor receptor cysteine-rich domain superfamily [Hexamita inflata]|uniref:Growth factor receptor cysteine-rich domain superfamily n=1 Tax=Hexamita inflata TaxID=28002 RepID=A0AA86USP1_9EUKA|nr:Growth factor receptor cysteine-rich domain superfamily [Hexamita inflata]
MGNPNNISHSLNITQLSFILAWSTFQTHVFGQYTSCWRNPDNVKFLIFKDKLCVCDEQQLYFHYQQLFQLILVINASGAKVVNNKCECDESKGYTGADPQSCADCWSQNKIVNSQLQECEACPAGSKYSSGTCVCDETSGYGGVDFKSCTKCWDQSKIVVNGQCQACDVGAIFEDTECVCDEKNGFVGDNAQSCTDCWSDSKIVVDSKCALCSDLDLNSVYDSENSCGCQLHFTKKNGTCQKVSVNQTIAIAIAVPAAVIILGIVSTIVIIKKKKSLKNVHAETPGQAQRVQ